MSKLLEDVSRVERFLKRQSKKSPFRFYDAPDPRQQSKVKHSIQAMLGALFVGLLGNEKTLRDVEERSETAGPFGQQKSGGLSDTALYQLTPRLDESYLIGKLVQQIRQMSRDKMLRDAGLPCGMAAIDGKNLATLKHDAGGRAHHRSSETVEKWRDPDDGNSHWLVPVVRCTLVSAAQKPCIYQLPVPPGTGEAAVFSQVVDALDASYGRANLIELLSGDAGLCSLGNADHAHDAGYLYMFGLKGNQKELFEAAQVVLYAKAGHCAPEAQTGWEKRGATSIQRQLWRTAELQGFENSVGTWEHLKQTWLVRQTTRDADGNVISTEDRFFVSSAPWRRFTPTEIITLVRAHWGVENDTFNSLDLQWLEDRGSWCTKGNAVWVLGLLRLMAYNLAQHLRRCHLCPKNDDGTTVSPIPWRRLFEVIRTALTLTGTNYAAAAPSSG